MSSALLVQEAIDGILVLSQGNYYIFTYGAVVEVILDDTVCFRGAKQMPCVPVHNDAGIADFKLRIYVAPFKYCTMTIFILQSNKTLSVLKSS